MFESGLLFYPRAFHSIVRRTGAKRNGTKGAGFIFAILDGMKRGIATFTLDYGKCPPWLFRRMVRLGGALTEQIVAEYGPDEFVRRLADPVWFQTLGTVLAFDWNASGLTTTLTGALKEALRGRERELGIYICGGKGKTSRKTPEQITHWGSVLDMPDAYTNALVYNSRMSAKVDSALIQDGYQIYHHTFFFTPSGGWTVVQQGMNEESATARRYHWHSANVRDLIEEPHVGIAAQMRGSSVLNLTASESSKTRDISTELLSGGYRALSKDIQLLREHSSELSKMAAVRHGENEAVTSVLANREFRTHPVQAEDLRRSAYLDRILQKLAVLRPDSYETLLATPGVGPKTVRALALVSEVLYGASPSYRDPARYSFAFGGKDATPFPVDRRAYDRVITIMDELIGKTRLPAKDKDAARAKLQKASRH